MVVASQNQAFFVRKLWKKGLISFYHISNTSLSFQKLELTLTSSKVKLQFDISGLLSNAVQDCKRYAFIKGLKKGDECVTTTFYPPKIDAVHSNEMEILVELEHLYRVSHK
jgi:hypothetical protein